MALTGDDFTAFFRAKKNGTYKCPVCSKEEFVYLGVAVNQPALFSLMAVSDTSTPLQNQHFYAIACTNCGHADFFHQLYVDQWVVLPKTKATNG